MPSLEIDDLTVVVVPRQTLAAVVADRSRWVAWWPQVDATVVVDRGLDGMTWTLAGALVGTSEVTLTAHDEGVHVRYVLRADPTDPGSRTTARRLPDSPHGRREVESLRVRHVMAWKRTVWAVPDGSGR